VYGVKTSSGVSAACLPAYFEAVDSYRQRLENEVGWHAGQNANSRPLPAVPRPAQQGSGTGLADKSGEVARQELARHGCLCTAPTLQFTATQPSIMKKHPEFFGSYQYRGLEDGHPFYERTTPPAGTANTKPVFLFYRATDQQWVFGPTRGRTSGAQYSSVEQSPAKCPGDPASQGKWQRKSSILGRWKVEPSLQLNCTK